MSYISVTNTFVDATAIDAAKVNENFGDIVVGLSDGTLDININNVQAQNLTGTTDIFTTGLTDYSTTSTIVGWGAFTTKQIFYKRLGSTVYVYFYLKGTNNSSGAYFTLPVNYNANIVNFQTLIYTNVDDATPYFGHGNFTSSNRFNMYPNQGGSFGWNGSGTATASGSFFYEV